MAVSLSERGMVPLPVSTCKVWMVTVGGAVSVFVNIFVFVKAHGLCRC